MPPTKTTQEKAVEAGVHEIVTARAIHELTNDVAEIKADVKDIHRMIRQSLLWAALALGGAVIALVVYIFTH